jgi:hypothetical protein
VFGLSKNRKTIDEKYRGLVHDYYVNPSYDVTWLALVKILLELQREILYEGFTETAKPDEHQIEINFFQSQLDQLEQSVAE